MSEYQYVAFRAIDAPVTAKHLEYMRRQSTRAEITPWSFDNEYHFGDFRGNAVEMLRRGYDIHLHLADFGICKLMIRLPNGFPDPAAAEPYLIKHGIVVHTDEQGPGGVLAIQPCYEPGELDVGSDFNDLLEDLAPLRAEILDGDLRPLYLGHLAVSLDGDHSSERIREAPVPAGLDDLTAAQLAFADLLGIDSELLAVAAQAAPKQTRARRRAGRTERLAWLRTVPARRKDEWLAKLIEQPEAAVRSEIVNEFRAGQQPCSWPTTPGLRTVSELRAAAEASKSSRPATKRVPASGKKRT